VLGYVRGNEVLAKDLVQDIYIKVWDNLDSFKGKSKISTWIYRIAINTTLTFLRTKKSLPIQTHIMDNTHAETIDNELPFRAMYHCIDKLEEKDRAIILFELQDLPQNEIADVMGMSHESIRTRIHRIKNKLSKCVSND